ncbi:hypothetical protein V5F38_13380 [Xanthobacter sp. V0B-10]|uniref:hypothetical protein n=1 Tax=Xanthobacter albus TaxID=3119929 RepID=UPI003726AED0
MPLPALLRRARRTASAAFPARLAPARPRAALLLACGVAVLPAAFPAPAAAQYLIYEQPYGYEPAPYGYERPPVYVPAPRGPLHYVMLPPSEVRRRLQAMGYWQISRPVLTGRVYSLTAADNEGLLSLQVDAYSGEVLRVRPVGALPPPAGRAPMVPPARIMAAPPRPVGPPANAPLPPSRPPEADIALSAPAVPLPAEAAPAPETAVAPPSAAPQAAPASVPDTGTPPPVAAGPEVAPASEPTSAGSATPGDTTAGSASILSRPSGTQ